MQETKKVNMGYDDDEEYGEEGTGYDRPRSPSPVKVIDVEKIKPNTEDNKGEIRLVLFLLLFVCLFKRYNRMMIVGCIDSRPTVPFGVGHAV